MPKNNMIYENIILLEEFMREKWIDVLKGLGMIFVCWGHLDPGRFMETHIYSFHMPLFFFISGYLFLRSNYDLNTCIKKKFQGLIKPYLIFAIISLIISLAMKITTIGDFKTNITNFFFLKGTVGWNSPLWFLVVLFICEVTYRALYNKFKFSIVNLSIFAIALIGYIVQKNNLVLPFGIHIVPIGMIFYHIGVLFKKFDMKEVVIKHKSIVCISTLIINILFSYVLNIRISVYHHDYGHFLFFIIAAISGILFYTTLAIIIQKNSILEFLGRNTLVILATQYILFKAFILIDRVLNLSVIGQDSTFLSLLMTIFTLLIYYVAIKLYDNLRGYVDSKKHKELI